MPRPGRGGRLAGAAGELARKHGPETVLSLPVRIKGEPQAVLTLERPAETPFVNEEIETVRLTCDLAAARLGELHQRDRWFGARAAGATRSALAAAVGPKHTWVKVAAIGVFAAAVFLIFATGTYRADCPFVLEATVQQAATAPFDGELAEVLVETGDEVVAGETVLARLDTLDIRQSQLPGERARLQEARTQASVAMRDGKIAEADAENVQIRVRGRPDLQLQGRVRRFLPAGQKRLPSPAPGYAVGGPVQTALDDPHGIQATERLFEVRISPADGSEAVLRPGQRAVARFRLPPKPLLSQARRALLQLAKRRFNI